jgi:hypothetical protein
MHDAWSCFMQGATEPKTEGIRYIRCIGGPIAASRKMRPLTLTYILHPTVSQMPKNIFVRLDEHKNFEFSFGNTAGATKNYIRDAALLQGGGLSQYGLGFTDDEILSAGEYQFIGGFSTGKTC